MLEEFVHAGVTRNCNLIGAHFWQARRPSAAFRAGQKLAARLRLASRRLRLTVEQPLWVCDLAAVDLHQIDAGHALAALLARGPLLDKCNVAVDALHMNAP